MKSVSVNCARGRGGGGKEGRVEWECGEVLLYDLLEGYVLLGL